MPESIAGYELERKIYESGKSLVYRTRPRPGASAVILKILKREYPSAEELVRYRQEYEVTRSVHSAHVIRVHGLERYRDTYVLLVEDFGGESLASWLSSGPLGVRELLRLALQLTQGLEDLHAAHIIHKDINPSNIIWNPRTDELKLIDFSISTRLSRETQTFRNPAHLEGTLAYMSPEQTGRMSRDVDYRTDFYSLGITLHELLAGQRPFISSDPLELVHLHLARAPPPLTRPEVSPALRRLVLKLMAKNAEDRYQSAQGLRADLARCLEALEAGQPAHEVDFALGAHDVPSRFNLPQRLYGRARELEQLGRAFEQVCRPPEPGEPAAPAPLLLVGGYSGVGKTALVQEVYKPLTQRRGVFISGKFESLRRNTPYLALQQALGAWCRHVLADSAQALGAWRQRILQEVGHNAQVLIELLPELALVLGPQPPVPELPHREAENRFLLTLHGLLRACGRADSPLVLFLDDLQWADAASLRLLTFLATSGALPHVLFLGSYRDNEVGPEHPLTMMWGELRQAGARLEFLHLDSLRREDLSELLADALRCPPERAEPLADVLYQKTRGNAFHVHELLKRLHEDGLITYSRERGEWQADPASLDALPLAGNVVELLGQKLVELPAGTRRTLVVAACLGSRFELRLLAICCRRRREEVLAELWPAATEGFVIPLDLNYRWLVATEEDAARVPDSEFRFQHDRVRQACDALLGPEERAQLHLDIGRLLLEHLGPAPHGEQLSAIVDHLNLGRELLAQGRAREELASLNLQAARWAREAMAPTQALRYATLGIELLPPDAWRTHYALCFALHRLRHESQYLSGDYEGADATARLLVAHARSALEKAEVHSTAVIQASIRGRYAEALALGRQAARLLGEELPEDTQLEARIEGALGALPSRLDARAVEPLLQQPMREPRLLQLGRLLASMVGAAYFQDMRLWTFLTLRSVHLGREHGAFNELPFSLGNAGVICVGRGQFQRGHALARLGVEVGERLRSTVRSRALNCLGLCVSPWAAPLPEAVEAARRGHLCGIEDGDLEFACYSLFGLLNALMYQGVPLAHLHEEAERAVAFAARQRNAMGAQCFALVRQLARNLQGLTEEAPRFDDGDFSEARFLERCAGMDMAHCYFHIYKMQALYLWGHYEEALRHGREADRTLEQVATFLPAVDHTYYLALSLTARWRELSGEERRQARPQLEAHQARLRRWADSCPGNFQHRLLLVEAELARLEGQGLEALRLYHRALALARAGGFTQDAACGHELAARFCLEQELTEDAEMHVSKAHQLYRRWGAARKVAWLEARHPHVLLRSTGASQAWVTWETVTGTPGTVLDAMSLVRASQAIGGELELERLLETLMRVVFETSGAQRGALLLVEGGEPRVACEGGVGQVRVHPGHGAPLGDWTGGPHSVLRYVQRTGQRVVLGEAQGEAQFGADPYMARARPRSLLCMPISNKGRLVALLYLDNPLAAHAFTQERTGLLEVLARQLAVSLENALLHAREREARAHAERAVRLRDEFLAVASHELNTPLTSMRLNLRQLKTLAGRAAAPAQLLGPLERAERQERRLARLITALLDVSKLEAGRLVLERSRFELGGLVREVLEGLAPECAQARCDCALDAPQAVTGLWDRGRLEQVVQNLLANALKFGAGGRIEVRIAQREGHAVLSVKDIGIGIAAEDQALIFEKFGRAVSEQHYGGLGLGLYLCQLFVQAHGGHIRVESSPQQGATFTVELPLEPPAPGPAGG